jgi:hypothetical protein
MGLKECSFCAGDIALRRWMDQSFPVHSFPPGFMNAATTRELSRYRVVIALARVLLIDCRR